MLNRLGNLSIIGKLLGLSPFRTMDPLCNFREPNLHLGWISAGYVGFRLHQWPQDAQTWRFQGPADIQIYDDFQRFSVLTRVYHLTLQVQQVCSMSPSAPGTNVQGRQGFRQALEMRRGRDQKRTSSCDSKASLCGSSLNILAVLRQRQAQSGRGYERRDWVALWHSGNIENSLHCKVVGSLPICGHSNVVLHLGRTGLSIVFIERHHHDIGVCYFNLSIFMPVSGFIMFQQLRN